MAQSVMSSSSSVISGDFGISTLAVDMANSLVSEIAGHIDVAAEIAADYLRDLPRSNGAWSAWRPVASLLEVGVEHGDIVISHSGSSSDAEHIMALEYGTGEQPPSPLARNNRDDIRDHVNSYLADEMRKDIPLA